MSASKKGVPLNKGGSGVVPFYGVFFYMPQKEIKIQKEVTIMKKHIFTVLLAFAFGLGLMLLMAKPSMAVHGGSGQLTCGQCHTMHNSQGNSSLGGAAGGTARLLRLSSTNTHELCLKCHSEGGSADVAYSNDLGTNINPPKVWTTNAWTGADFFNKIGAGGDFRSIGTVTAAGVVTLTVSGGDDVNALGYGHSLGITNPIPPGNNAGDTPLTVLTCTNCHDPHGTKVYPINANGVNMFRMLKSKPVGGGTTGGSSLETTGVTVRAVSYAGAASAATSGAIASNLKGTDYTGSAYGSGQQHIWPVYKGATSQNVYSSSAVGEGISAWCAQCHDNWHENIASGNLITGPTGDWKRHPVDVNLNCSDGSGSNDRLGLAGCASGSGTSIIDWNHYSTEIPGTATKLPTAKVANAALGDSSSLTYYATSNTDKVFCLSCHFAHAGPYFDNLRWNYSTNVLAGDQTGLSINSVTGCQQCHNRGT